MAKVQNWLPEAEAAKKINLQPRTLRRYAKSGKLNVTYRTLNNRNYQYEESTLESVFEIKKAVCS